MKVEQPRLGKVTRQELMEGSYYPLDPGPTIPGLHLTFQVSDSQERESNGSSLEHMLPILPDLFCCFFFFYGQGSAWVFRYAWERPFPKKRVSRMSISHPMRDAPYEEFLL